MNLEDVLQKDFGLQQDCWTMTSPTFGDSDQLEVIGWSGKVCKSKSFVLKCRTCALDPELHGDGYFKSSRASLTNGGLPCGCSKRPSWSKDQFEVLAKRKAESVGFKFKGTHGEWLGTKTKIILECAKHGEWGTGTIHSLISAGRGCPVCRLELLTKPDADMIESFMSSGVFHPDTKFWRSSRKNNRGSIDYWHFFCPDCQGFGESSNSSLKSGKKSCDCSRYKPTDAYVNTVTNEDGVIIAIKFGITRSGNSLNRARQQSTKSIYNVENHSVFKFKSSKDCHNAERLCKEGMVCGILLKEEFKDGYTETTFASNIDRVIHIYKEMGGLLYE